MKKSLYIPILVAIVVALTSCEQEYTQGTNWGDWEIFRGYMQFSTGVSSRAQLATNLRGREFGVFGYQYNTTTTWQYAKATATPNVFYNQKVECDANGSCTYDVDNNTNGDQYKQWEESHYSFFAYHPYGGSGISFSGQNDVNTPMLTYTYGWLNNSNQYIDATASSDIFDLMTAEHIDADGSTNVGLDFKHRLFAIEVLANNYNENIYEYDEVPVLDENGNQVEDADGNPVYEQVIRKDVDGNPVFAPDYYKKDAQGNLIQDENGKPILVKGNARQNIGMLTIKLEGLRHSSMTIPMSTRSGEAKPDYTTTTSFSKEFIITMNDVEVPAYNETTLWPDGKETGGGIPTSISKYGSDGGGGYLMLIPQDAIEGQNYNIKFSLNWLNRPANSEEVKTDFEATIDFEPGRLYQVTINFVGSGITIALIEAGSWEPLTVIHTFE